MCDCIDCEYCYTNDTMKETPLKPSYAAYGFFECPSCGNITRRIWGGNYDRCPNCGQRIDWGNENEKISRSIK